MAQKVVALKNSVPGNCVAAASQLLSWGSQARQRTACRSSSRAVPVAAMAGLWLWTSWANDAAVKKIEATKNVSASASAPTAAAYAGTAPTAKPAAPIMNSTAMVVFRRRGLSSMSRSMSQDYSPIYWAREGGDVLTDSSEDWVREDLAAAGLAGIGEVHRNLPYAELVARSLARKEGILASNGALVVRTGLRTGRSPHDRFIVDSKAVHDTVDWGAVNKPCTRRVFDHLLDKASAFLQHRESFIFDGYAGADPSTAAHSGGRRGHLARPLRPHALPAAHERRAARALRPGDHGDRLRRAHRLAQVRRGPLRGVRGARPRAPPRADRGHHVRRRDQEVGLHAAQLPAARARRAAHALRRQPGPRRRRGALLRAFGHGQDDAVGRPAAPPDRRRRARLERPRRLQLRGRLLRQGHPPVTARRAADRARRCASARSSRT